MKLNKKIITFLPIMFSVGALASCNNKTSEDTLETLTYTLVSISLSKSSTVKFECNNDANLTVDWGDSTIDSNHSHTYQKRGHWIIFITGNLKEISFSNENGAYEEGNDDIDAIFFSSTVTSLPAYSFNLPTLHEVILPKSITSIGEHAFVTKYETANTIFFIAAEAKPNGWANTWARTDTFFDYCIWDVKIGTVDESIYVCTSFYGDDNGFLVDYYGDDAIPVTRDTVSIDGKEYKVVSVDFYGNDTVESIQVPRYVNSIGANCFSECSKLKTIDFSRCENLEFICDWAFDSCHSLSEFCLPKSIKKIGANVFNFTDNLTSLTVEPGNEVFSSPDGSNVIFNHLTSTVVAGCKTSKIPSNTKIIGDSAFAWCPTLTSIKIPSSVVKICNNAFAYCEALASVDLTDFVQLQDIPSCIGDAFEHPFYYGVDLTFYYNSSGGLTEEDFISKGWPKAEEKIKWEGINL